MTNRLRNLVQQLASDNEDEGHHNGRQDDSVDVDHESGCAEQVEVCKQFVKCFKD